MVCIYCSGETAVINSRLQKRHNQVWRRRKCLECGSIFSTHELAEYRTNWMVRDKSAKPRPFERDRLFLSLYRSCEHRPTALTDAAGLADTIIGKLQTQAESGLLDRRDIIQTVQVALNRFDAAASVHYRAFHRL